MSATRFKVLHVSTTSAGGLGTSLMSIMRALDSSRFEVHVALGLGYPLDSAFEPAGIRLHPLDLSRGIHPVQFARSLVRLVRLMARERYDIVHVHGSEAGILGRLAARVVGIPVAVVELHGYANRDPHGVLERTLYRWVEKALDGMTDAYVAVSEHVRRQWIDRGICRPDRVQVIYHALDLKVFQDCGEVPRAQRPENGPVVGTVCLLEARKGLASLLEAIPTVVHEVPGVRFAIAGEGPLEPWMRQRVEELGITGKVDFLGWRTDVPELMRGFDVFALPSRRESFGLVFLEAMACRCPVVGSRVDGIPEVVTDGETGILVPPDDSRALASAIVELLTDVDKAKRLAEAGRKRVESCFGMDRMARQYNDLYLRLLEGTGVTRAHQ
jgi:glycosyltransferase involved in cell wall biosynthesis